MKTQSRERLVKLVKIAVLSALSVVLVYLIRFPIFPSASYLEYDPADIPILIATFAFGPIWGLAMTVVVSVLQGLTVSSASGIYGIIMHIIATGSYVLVAGFVYKCKHNFWGALTGIVAGTITMASVMAGANLVVTPLFLGVPRQAVVPLLLPVIVPFNLIKAGINGAVTLLIYKKISGILKGK